MADSSLLRAVDDAVKEYRDLAPGCLLGSTEMTKVLAPVTEELSRHLQFGHLPNKFFGQKQIVFTPLIQALNIVRHASERSSTSAIAWYRRVSLCEATYVISISAVYGIKIDRRHEFSNGVSLAPLSELSEFPNARALIQHSQFGLGTVSSLMEPPCTAVITQWVSATNDFATSAPDLDVLRRTVEAVALCDDFAPSVGISWHEFVDPDLRAAEFGRMWRGDRSEGLPPSGIPPTITDEATNWVEAYFNLRPGTKKRCDIAIPRLSLGRRRSTSGDKAIEAGICLEALLGDENGEDLTYKLRLRCALLLSKDPEERRAIRKQVADLYGLRSKAVHGRMNDEALANEKNVGIAAAGLKFCGRVLQRIVQLNDDSSPSHWEINDGPIWPIWEDPVA